jgi:hypothetical protein
LKIIRRFAFLFLVNTVCGDEIYPTITSDTVVGVWEAAPAWAGGSVYRLEINRTGPSYLAVILGSEELVCRSTFRRVQNGRISLHFHCLTDRRFRQYPHGGPDLNELDISGKGRATEINGVIEASLKMRWRTLDPIESTSLEFSKPPWTRRAAEESRKCEALIKHLKSR